MSARTSTTQIRTEAMPDDTSTGPIAAKISSARFACYIVLLSVFVVTASDATAADKPVGHLAGTAVMPEMKDPAAEMVAGIDRFLLNRLEALREQRYQQAVVGVGGALGSADAYRQRLAWILGVRDERVPFDAPELIATADDSAVLAGNDGFEVLAVRWPVVADVWAEGLLIRPTAAKGPIADVIVIPDADQTPEQLAGLVDGFPEDLQAARKLAEQGCRVLVPALVSRTMEKRSPAEGTRAVTISNREFVYRSSFVLGRHLIG